MKALISLTLFLFISPLLYAVMSDAAHLIQKRDDHDDDDHHHDDDLDENPCSIPDICGHRGICTETPDSFRCDCDDMHFGGGIGKPCRELIHWTFHMFDQNGDDFISKQDMKSVLAILNQPNSDADIALEWQIGDKNGDGLISEEEYDYYYVTMLKQDPDYALGPWKGMDINNDGDITADELVRMHAALGIQYSFDEAEHILEQADDNGDGIVDWRELGYWSLLYREADSLADEEHHHDHEDDDDDDIIKR